jgi:hypothetical protein
LESTPLHPALVHLPIALAILLPLIALSVAVPLLRGKLPRAAWALPLALQVLLVGSGIAAMRSGEAEEERVESVVSEHAIEEHEEAAELFVQVAAALTLVYVLGVALPRPNLRGPAMLVAAVGSLGVAALAVRAGHAGGELVYVHGAASAYAGAGAPSEARGAREDERHEAHDEDD